MLLIYDDEEPKDLLELSKAEQKQGKNFSGTSEASVSISSFAMVFEANGEHCNRVLSLFYKASNNMISTFSRFALSYSMP